MRDVVAQAQKRIEHAKKTQAALARVENHPSPENLAALHRLHTEHLREDGDHEGAARAEARAKHAESMTQRPTTLLADEDRTSRLVEFDEKEISAR
jgi:hypothetical protein